MREIIVLAIFFSFIFLSSSVKADCTTFENGTQLCNVDIVQGIGMQNPDGSNSIYNNNSTLGISTQNSIQSNFIDNNLSLASQSVSFSSAITLSNISANNMINTTTTNPSITTTSTTTTTAVPATETGFDFTIPVLSITLVAVAAFAFYWFFYRKWKNKLGTKGNEIELDHFFGGR
jgi:hypothetical protein